VLRYHLIVERYEESVPLVREARLDPLLSRTTLYGRLLVPDAGPAGEAMSLAAARVETAGGRRSATSDAGGLFHLENVLPDHSGAICLTVKARGQVFEKSVSETGSAAAPVTIEVPLGVARLGGRLEDRAGDALSGVRIEVPSRRQYTHSRADGRFLLDGLPASFDPSQIRASSGGESLDVRVDAGVVVFTLNRAGLPEEPVAIEFSS
jgi:hypothetical protein